MTLATGAGTLDARRAALDPAVAPPLPDYVLQFIARLRLLIGVPFSYLVPDAKLLPLESARFFHLDPKWLDQLGLGALSVGAGGTREQAQSELLLAPVQSALGIHLRLVRDLQRGRGVLDTALQDTTETVDEGADITGMIVRSALVSGWPALQVRAYVTDDETQVPADADPSKLDPSLSVPILRMERLDPSVLIVLFAGVPRLVWLEEPHHGVQLGVDAKQGGGFDVHLRDATGAERGAVNVAFRGTADLGVVDVAGLARAMDAALPLAKPRGSAALALSLVQAPARQRFTASGGTS